MSDRTESATMVVDVTVDDPPTVWLSDRPVVLEGKDLVAELHWGGCEKHKPGRVRDAVFYLGWAEEIAGPVTMPWSGWVALAEAILAHPNTAAVRGNK